MLQLDMGLERSERQRLSRPPGFLHMSQARLLGTVESRGQIGEPQVSESSTKVGK